MRAGVLLYKILIDPLLSGLRKSVKSQIEPGTSALDIACGTGAMVFRLMDHCSSVTGIDMDLPKITAAQREVEFQGLSHLYFEYRDATDLADYEDDKFDVAMMSMAIHQFNPSIREGILREASRVAKTVIVADYSHPSPASPSGWLAVFIEFLAGKEHYGNYLNYQAHGGMPGLLKKMDIPFEQVDRKGAGVFSVYHLRKI